MKHVWWRVVCVLLLLYAQQSALTHAAWHAGADRPTQHQSKGKASLQGGLCDLHHAFSQVLGGVQATMPPYLPVNGVWDLIARACHSSRFIAFLAPLSRGPPFTLLA